MAVKMTRVAQHTAMREYMATQAQVIFRGRSNSSSKMIPCDITFPVLEMVCGIVKLSLLDDGSTLQPCERRSNEISLGRLKWTIWVSIQLMEIL